MEGLIRIAATILADIILFYSLFFNHKRRRGFLFAMTWIEFIEILGLSLSKSWRGFRRNFFYEGKTPNIDPAHWRNRYI